MVYVRKVLAFLSPQACVLIAYLHPRLVTNKCDFRDFCHVGGNFIKLAFFLFGQIFNPGLPEAILASFGELLFGLSAFGTPPPLACADKHRCCYTFQSSLSFLQQLLLKGFLLRFRRSMAHSHFTKLNEDTLKLAEAQGLCFFNTIHFETSHALLESDISMLNLQDS